MARLVKLAVLVAVVYFAYTQGWPWLSNHLKEHSTPPDSYVASDQQEVQDAQRCVDAATRANETFTGGYAQYAVRNADTAGWMRFAGGVQNQIRDAESACACTHDACTQAQAAMQQLEGVVDQMDGFVRGSAETMSNPANQEQEVYDLLNSAHAALSKG